MRNLFVLLIFFSTVQLYPQSANYPEIMNNGTIFINTGVGFGKTIEAKRSCPPITVSMDIAIPVMSFPITLGLIAGYLSESGKVTEKVPFLTTETSTDLSALLVAGRIAYHLNFFNKLPRLDPYILLTIGGIFAEVNSEKEGYYWLGFCAGARYFFLPNMGAFVELGFDTVQNCSLGLSFRL